MKDQTVLVTGATSDIGRAICERFGAAGYHVFAHARNPHKGEVLRQELENQDISVEILLADLLAEGAPEALLRHTRESKRPLTAVVNNAGGIVESRFELGTVVDPTPSYRVNVFVPYAICVLAAQQMKDGSIVNISSVQAHATRGPDVPHYGGSKAALSHLTKLLALNLAPNVRVNAVSPGRTFTSAWGEISEDRVARMADELLIKRWIQPSEIADGVWFLTQNRACTGTDLIIDGGIGLRFP